MSSSQLCRLAIAFAVAFLMAPFAQAQSGGQDGPLAVKMELDLVKHPPLADYWKPLSRKPSPPPPGGGDPPDDGTTGGTGGDDGDGDDDDDVDDDDDCNSFWAAS